jgi:hypothetical protein
MWYEKGDVFIGKWQQGLKSGQGTLKAHDFQIIGQWVND